MKTHKSLRTRTKTLGKRKRLQYFKEFAASQDKRHHLSKFDRQWMKQVDMIMLRELHSSEFHMDQLAGELAFCRRQCERRMKKITGMTPSWYLRTMRLLIANAMLRSGEYVSVKEVARKVGFASCPHFSKVYKDHFEVAPSAVLHT